MKIVYEFEQQHGQLVDGYTVLHIVDGEAVVTNKTEKALAERYGGKPRPEVAKEPAAKPKAEGAKAAAEKPGGKD